MNHRGHRGGTGETKNKQERPSKSQSLGEKEEVVPVLDRGGTEREVPSHTNANRYNRSEMKKALR